MATATVSRMVSAVSIVRRGRRFRKRYSAIETRARLKLQVLRQATSIPSTMDLAIWQTPPISTVRGVYIGGQCGEKIPFEGVSDLSYNITGYFERGAFQARLAYSFRDDFVLIAGDVLGNNLFVDGYRQLDASLSYSRGEYAVFLNIVNLTDEETLIYSDVEERPVSYSLVGRRVQLGLERLLKHWRKTAKLQRQVYRRSVSPHATLHPRNGCETGRSDHAELARVSSSLPWIALRISSLVPMAHSHKRLHDGKAGPRGSAFLCARRDAHPHAWHRFGAGHLQEEGKPRGVAVGRQCRCGIIWRF